MASIVVKLKDFFADFTYHRDNKARRNPIEILKRLQREAFSDLMKQRDRLDKVEKVLTLYGSSKGGPFRGHGTHVGGEVDLMGTLYLKDYLDLENVDAIKRSGIKTGVGARITFETKVRAKDVLQAEFTSCQSSHAESSESVGSGLCLARISYTANMTDWFSIAAIPMGARCRDVAVSTNPQEKGLSDYSSFGPPLLHEDHGRAIGITVKKSNIVASLAQFVVDLPSSLGSCFSTFGQIVYQLPRSTKLSLFGHYQVTKPRQPGNLGPLTMSLANLRPRRPPQASADASSPSLPTATSSKESAPPEGSFAAMLESELDESTRVQGWVQMNNTDPRHLQWALSMSDFPEDDIGWGLSLGGSMHHPASWDHFQVEAFLKFNLGSKFSLQPGFVYLMDRNNQVPALMLRSTWSL